MTQMHPKTVRRRILEILYECYMADPLDMPTPERILESGTVPREALVANAHYLLDRGYIELMFGYRPPLFTAARITPAGIDAVENAFEFNLRFPDAPDAADQRTLELAALMERLVEEADFVALDGERRQALLRDVQFLRDEAARPAARWRREVMTAVLGWIAQATTGCGDALPSLERVQALVEELVREDG